MKYNSIEEEFNQYRKELDLIILDTINKIKNYSGDIVNGLYEGKGVLYNNNGTIKYKGNFKKGKYDGFGRLYEEEKL